ncbi:MAG: nitroreductase [Methylobacteriaceae bacterium]|jgi:nitroreductase|nr:nitroreductase [Methylobacteriaceae bacterium]
MSDTNIRFLDQLITTRRSCRAFKPDPVPEPVIRDILDTARWAPSATNIQPWHVRVVTGGPLKALAAELTAVDNDPEQQAAHKREVAYYPAQWRAPYYERRKRVGIQLYSSIGIPKGDKERMQAQHNRNFKFFDAPVAMVFTIDRDLAIGSWLDYGFFLQNILLAAAVRGLATCVQAGPTQYHLIFRKHLNIPDTEVMVVCIALGQAIPDAPTASFTPEREEVDTFATFIS